MQFINVVSPKGYNRRTEAVESFQNFVIILLLFKNDIGLHEYIYIFACPRSSQ